MVCNKHLVSVIKTVCLTSFIVAYSLSLTTKTLARQADNLPPGLTREDARYDLVDTVQSNPTLGKTPPKKNGRYKIAQRVTNRSTKHALNKFSHDVMKNANLSVIRGHKGHFSEYPSGGQLFPGKPDLAGKFSDLLTMLQNNHEFIKFYRKIHLNALNELYDYLMKIYTNFNLRHVGSKEKDNTVSIHVEEYLEDEATYATNKKTLIINHLVNIIEAQFNSAVRGMMKNVPHLTATSAGKTMIQADYSTDLTAVLVEEESKFLREKYDAELKKLGQYLLFFEEYTSYLMQPDPLAGLTEFANIAQHLHTFLGNHVDDIITKTNPPMFFFDDESMRAVKLIPKLVEDMPKNVKKITFPDAILQAAGKAKLAKIDSGVTSFAAHPIAYFKDQYGRVVTKDISTARSLYVVTVQGQNLFEQELLLEPDWMHKIKETMNILRGCLGDIRALMGYNILDPCTEAIIDKAYSLAKGTPINQELQQKAKKWISYLKSDHLRPFHVPDENDTSNAPNMIQPQLPPLAPHELTHGSLTNQQQDELQGQIQNLNIGAPADYQENKSLAPSSNDISMGG